jgi:hypothetical protein
VHLDWRAIGSVTLAVVFVLLAYAGLDCLRVAIQDWRTAQRDYDLQIARLVGLTGLGLLALAALAWWGHVALR